MASELILPTGGQWLGSALCCAGVSIAALYVTWLAFRRSRHVGRHR